MTKKSQAIFRQSTKILILGLISCFWAVGLSAQDRPHPDSLVISTNEINLDSIRQANTRPSFRDSLPKPVRSNGNANPLNNVKLADDALDEPIDYSSRDSMKIDAENKKILLYGGAEIIYTNVNLKADFIEFDWGNNIVTASGLTDSLGRITGKPKFTDGTENFDAGVIKYNFKTQKGLITDAVSIQQNLYVQGKRTKYVSSGGDTTKSDIIYNRDAIFTTCDLDHPHYGVRSTKQKVIPNKVVVIGPSNVEISDIPTPLWLPFGFFPISTGASTGLIFPKGYEYDPQWGFGLAEVGWYFPINDYVNFKATGDIYVKGTYKLKGQANYRRRYRYTGNFRMEYANYNNEKTDGTRARDKAFILNWAHRQDPKANPNRSFGGSINFQTNNALSKTSNSLKAVETGSISSNFTYDEKFPGRPYTLSVGLRHSQNTSTRAVTVEAPTATFRLSRINPFKRKNPVGGKKWYEDVAIDYTGETRNRLTGTDTTFFQNETLETAQFGARHKTSLSTKFRALKYINISPSANYEEIWFFKTLEKEFEPTFDTLISVDNGIETIDTVTRGTVTDTLVNGFTPYRKFNMNVSLNTKLFGTMLFKKGKLRGIRHTLTPTLGFTYAPDQSNYYQTVRTDTFEPDEEDEYNVFQGGIYSASPQRGERMSLNYGLGNVLDAKFFSKKDSTTRNVTLLRTLSIGGNYNFAADTLNFSQVSARTNAKFFNGITNVSLSAVFDPYIENENGRRQNTFYWRTNGKPLRFDNFTSTVNSSLTVKKLREILTGDRDEDEDPGAPKEDDLEDTILNDRGQIDFENLPLATAEEIDAKEKLRLKKLEEEELKKKENEFKKEDFLSLFENFGVNHTFRLKVERIEDRDTVVVQANSLSLRGSIQLTDRWKFTGLSFGYDFQTKRLTYPTIGIQRDLHCWVMGGSWQPQRGTFSFYLRVRPGSTLDFLNVPYKKSRPPANVFD
ncbi:MAG: hypothetical protein ACI85O_001765 [Saprospiraceae bacterium]|jgi:hypothetical protein